jgi:hypothetical protein
MTTTENPATLTRAHELMGMTKPQLKTLAKATVRPGYEDRNIGRTVWSVTGSGASKWELAYHIARIEVEGT